MDSNHLPKLLICTQNDEFLRGHLAILNSSFQIQFALTQEMVAFLTKEWEPQLCIIEASKYADKTVSFLRSQFPYHQLGLIVLADSSDPNFSVKETACFRSGVDHFIPTPKTDPGQLMLRAMSLIRKMRASYGQESELLHLEQFGGHSKIDYGPITIMPQDFVVKVYNQLISTTPTQFRLLLAFISHKDQLLSRVWLKKAVWGETSISPRTIDAQVSKLKKIIPFLDSRLINVYGKGYILTESQKEVA